MSLLGSLSPGDSIAFALAIFTPLSTWYVVRREDDRRVWEEQCRRAVARQDRIRTDLTKLLDAVSTMRRSQRRMLYLRPGETSESVSASILHEVGDAFADFLHVESRLRIEGVGTAVQVVVEVQKAFLDYVWGLQSNREQSGSVPVEQLDRCEADLEAGVEQFLAFARVEMDAAVVHVRRPFIRLGVAVGWSWCRRSVTQAGQLLRRGLPG